jgi:hypothetical protein
MFMVLAAEYGLSEVLATLFVAGLFAVWVLLIILMLADMFGDPSLSGPAKAGWTVLIVFFPLIGIFAYLVVRGEGFGRRVGAELAERRTAGAGQDD